jgi:3-oxoacyl-[acyl-carrier protein] reductase
MANQRKVAFVTGVSRGIGRGIAIELAKRGFDIGGNSRTVDPSQTETGILEVSKRVAELGARFLALEGDVARLDDHARILDRTLAEYGRIDVFVNNAGVAPEKRVDVLEMTPESFDRVLSINLRGSVFFTQRVARQMIEQVKASPETTASIVFVTSVSAYMSSPSRAEYCISKAGLSHAAAIFADRLSEFGVNVYEVRPGIIQTDMTSAVQEKYDKLIAEGLIPQRRWGFPEDVGRAVGALVSGDFSYSSGTVLEVSGGMNLRRL